MVNHKSHGIKNLWDNKLNPGTKTQRERTQDQTIGTANSRSIVKDKVLVSLRKTCALVK